MKELTKGIIIIIFFIAIFAIHSVFLHELQHKLDMEIYASEDSFCFFNCGENIGEYNFYYNSNEISKEFIGNEIFKSEIRAHIITFITMLFGGVVGINFALKLIK